MTRNTNPMIISILIHFTHVHALSALVSLCACRAFSPNKQAKPLYTCCEAVLSRVGNLASQVPCISIPQLRQAEDAETVP